MVGCGRIRDRIKILYSVLSGCVWCSGRLYDAKVESANACTMQNAPVTGSPMSCSTKTSVQSR